MTDDAVDPVARHSSLNMPSLNDVFAVALDSATVVVDHGQVAFVCRLHIHSDDDDDGLVKGKTPSFLLMKMPLPLPP